MKEWPFGLKAVLIGAIVFGVLGILGGGFGLLGLFMKPQNPATMGNAAQAELNQRIQEHAKKMRPVQLILVPAMLATSVLLLAAGISGLKLQGLGFIRLAFVASLVTDSISAIFGISAQIKMIDLMQDYVKNAGADPAVATGMKFGVSVGLFFAVGWLVAKVGFYVGSLVLFSKRAVREAFSPPPAPL
ncbi:MAG TPA: hypothetical protein VNM14_12560 [Planctomycetota bacterium]|jgi:hypothetical protein|nr:hypothetical protein [Planctomycetota bacterium]